MIATQPSRPEDFLEIVERSRRGKLRVYLGFAAGVGKTYRMLEEAHALAKRRVDVVIAFVETHNRAETEALVSGLELVPRRRIEYRGVVVEEMDFDAVLARAPAVAIVDEIPHTNVPGSRYRKRYQEIIALLEAGINVIGAMNIQHLESLNDLVARTTHVTVRETVPDSFFDYVSQIINVDLDVDDLVERLRTGKIYAKDKVEGALGNFFTGDNLATLRELALRQVAETLERHQGTQQRRESPASLASDRGRIMVCMASSSPHALALLRRGSRAAGRLSTDWFVVYVETPRESPELIDSEAQRHLLANIQLARELGAEVMRIKGADPVATILDFARSHGVGQIIIGRSKKSWWHQLFARSVPLRLVREAEGFDVLIVSVEERR